MSVDLRSLLAKARDAWLKSDEGRRCNIGIASGQYLENRLVLAFLAGAEFNSAAVERRAIAEEVEGLISEERARGADGGSSYICACKHVLQLLSRRGGGK